MNALSCKKEEMETMNYSKNDLTQGLILFPAIYQMHAVLNLLIIHEKEKTVIFLLLVKQNPLYTANAKDNWLQIWTASSNLFHNFIMSI